VREIKEEQANAEKIKEVRQKLAESKQELATEIEPLAAKKDFVALLPKRAMLKKEQQEEDVSPIQVGDMVLMTETMTVGEITQLSGQDITISFNSVSLRTTLNKVEKVSKQAARQMKRGNTRYNEGTVADMMQKKIATFQTTLDMRGMRADEGLAALESYINEAILLRIQQVKILHGTGTGVLRQIVRQFLSKQRKITSFHDEDLERGGYGITVVNF
ncbi:MAG: Smr/MutS family protein, partial [Bacteroidales bacterium]|nr:Smr/MutS family protein [Bacteroidales bacterium]